MMKQNETKQNVSKHVTRQNKLLALLSSSESGWVARPEVLRRMWPVLFRDNPKQAKRNLACQLSYLRKRGVVTEQRRDVYANMAGQFGVWIRLAPSRAPPAAPE